MVRSNGYCAVKCRSTNDYGHVHGGADVAVLAGFSMLVLNTFITWKVKRSRIQREGLVECAHIRRSCRSQYVHGAKIKEISALVNRAVHNLLRVTTPSHEGPFRPLAKECCGCRFYLVAGKRAELAAPSSHCTSI